MVAYLKAWLEVANDFKDKPDKVADTIYSFFTSKGFNVAGHVPQGAGERRREAGLPSDLKPYMQEQAEILLKEKKIEAIPDWSKALRTEFMKQASA